MGRLIPSNPCHDLRPHLTSLCFPMIQVTTGGRASYYVSYRREAFAQIKLPKYSLPKVLTTCFLGPARQSGRERLPCWDVGDLISAWETDDVQPDLTNAGLGLCWYR